MFEKYKQKNGAYDFTPQNGESASEFAIERIEHCSPDIRRNCLDEIVYELCNIYYDEWRAYNPQLRPVHKKVGGEWVRVDPPTAAREANDRHLENYNNALALLCSVVYDAGRIYGIRCTANLIRHMEWQGFNKVIPFFDETLKGEDSLARNNECGGACGGTEGKERKASTVPTVTDAMVDDFHCKFGADKKDYSREILEHIAPLPSSRIAHYLFRAMAEWDLLNDDLQVSELHQWLKDNGFKVAGYRAFVKTFK